MSRWEKLCSKQFSQYFKAKNLPEGSLEIDKTPDIRHSAIVEPIHCLLLHSLQVWLRNEFFTVTQNISTPPHYISCGEPFTKREENTQVTRQLLANDLAFLICFFQSFREELFALCQKSSPHAKSCGEV